jgi:hypothetical protein
MMSQHFRIRAFGFALVLVFQLLFATASRSQSLPTFSTSFRLLHAISDSILQLPHRFIATNSDSVVLDSMRTLRRGIEYQIDYRLGRISLDSIVVRSHHIDSTKQHVITVQYQYFPFRFQDSYFKRRLLVLRDSTGRDSIRISKPRASFGLTDIFGENLQKSGSIVRGFTVGSNRDFSLNSGLRLQLAGKLASDIDIVAALTDENTPIQPEGTTQTLQEFDKVFVELRATDASATLGDFNLDLVGTEFARMNRKLQGAKASATYRLGFSDGTVLASAATTRGKFNTNQFQGLDAVQGPYRLTGRNNERQIIIIAGTERVYVNGEQMTRGETNDYTIEYSTGEVTFTTRRLITSASRITIDFEYTDRQFARSLLAAQTSTNFLDNKATLTFSFLREADDPDAPIDFSITDSARNALQLAGDDRNKATLSGVTRVDSNGYYVQDSATVGGVLYRFFRYAPRREATFIVTFSSVGFGQGEYIRQAVGVFVWKGPGQGDYLPIRFLPLPQLSQVLDVALDASPTRELKVTGEFASSRFDANRLSTRDDSDNTGHALRFEAAYSPREFSIGDTKLGSFDLRVRERFVNRRFVPIDRTNDIEFNRKWGIEGVSSSDEEIQEGLLKYFPTRSITVGGGYGKITRGADLRSVRNDASFVMNGDSLPTVNYVFESVRTREAAVDNWSKWIRQNGSAEHRIGNVSPFFRFENEDRQIRFLSKDSMKSGSFAFTALSGGVRVRELWNMSLGAHFEWRTDDKFLDGSTSRESKSFTQSYTWKLSEWNSLSSSLDVTLRDKTFTQPFKLLGNKDITTVLVRNQTRYAPFNRGVETDLFYEVSTERSSRLERVFVRVAIGTGNYKYLGDLNNNGVAEENEFQLARFDGDYIAITVPSDQLFPVIDLKTSARVRITPSRFLAQGEGALVELLNMITAESYVRVEEKSSEPDLKQIYLLHFRKFQTDSTISGSTLFTQDINVLEGRPDFSARLRYTQRKGVNKFASSSSSGTQERSFTRERSLRLRWQLVSEIANQLDFINRNDRLSSNEVSSRLRDIESNTLSFDLSYRPYQNFEMGIKFDVGTSTDRFQKPEVTADLNTQSLRFVYAFQGAGQARVETAREEVLLNRGGDTFPFELTGGRVAGKTYVWRAAFDYRVTQFVQATLNYDGRTEGGRSPVHTARAEVRAFF